MGLTVLRVQFIIVFSILFFGFVFIPLQLNHGSKTGSGINCWDLNENGDCDLATEDLNNDGVCNVHDCRLPATETTYTLPSTQVLTPCWDLDSNGECDLETEDLNGDGLCDRKDCYGVSCWDLNANAACDLEEDKNGDGICDASDCKAVLGYWNARCEADGNPLHIVSEGGATFPFKKVNTTTGTFDNNGHSFDVEVTGLYLITASMNFEILTSNSEAIFMLRTSYQGDVTIKYVTKPNNELVFHEMLYLEAGDTVLVYMANENENDIDLYPISGSFIGLLMN
jgi:hypothetical protein